MTGTASGTTESLKRWFPVRTPPSRSGTGTLQLFCLPYAGAGASLYRGWDGLLPSSISIAPVQLPGRENRCSEPPRTSVVQIAEELTAVLASAISGPYAIFGYSMGALIAYETALHLRRAGLPMPAGLVLAAHQTPHRPLTRKPAWHLPDDEFLRDLRDMGGMSDPVFSQPELIEFLLPTLRADFKACDTYCFRGEAPLNIPFSVFGGWKDPHVSPELLELWSELSSKRCTTHMFPGGHFFIKENRDLMLRTLAQCLAAWHKL